MTSMTTLSFPTDQSCLESGLTRLRDIVVEMGELVDRAIGGALAGLTERHLDSCTMVIAEQARIDELQGEARDLCSAIVHLPAVTPTHLVKTTTLEYMSAELQRVGDHCVKVAEIARDLEELPNTPAMADLSTLGRLCGKQVRDILRAVGLADPHRARFVASNDNRVDTVYRRAFENLRLFKTDGEVVTLPAIRLALVARHIQRIADRVMNIAEAVVYAETGRVEAFA
jgi:phosphate transport system protein